MTSTRARRQRRKRAILIFGEDENDTRFIAELIRTLCPDLAHSVKPLRRPPVLIKDASPADIPQRVDTIAALVDAEDATTDVICIFAHEDCDALEPAHVALAAKIEGAFARRGYSVHAVTPAWELESWLFQFPDAVTAYRPTWRSLHAFSGRNVGLIADAKESLRRALRPAGAGNATRDYQESDAQEIAKYINSLGLARSPVAKSASYQAFVSAVDGCCANAGS